ncbi:MAG: type II toxin-antitoxin system VapC family toxin [Anaerolineales bacterium]|nr:type II toxin-antitoxin system VapC family toxin [Anaerolineales bacterium]
MRLLLDTQIFIWWDSDLNRLPSHILALIQNPENTLVLSVASVWEIQIKAQLGKLDLNRPLTEIVQEQERTNRLELMPVQASHIYALDQLPFHHKDPFDRLLMAQALMEEMPILTVDSVFTLYPVQVIGS